MRTEPLLFVLDEPTVTRYMARARDLAAHTGADHILVLDRGRLVEQGGHRKLTAAGGRYADLYTLQAAAYAAPAFRTARGRGPRTRRAGPPPGRS